MSRDKAELAQLAARIRDLVLKKPEKAAIILTNWFKTKPTRKKQAA